MRVARKVLPILMSAILVVSLCPGLAFANPGEGGGSASDVSVADDQASTEQLEAMAEIVSAVEEPGENVFGSAYPVVEGFDEATDADVSLVAQSFDADAPLTAQATFSDINQSSVWLKQQVTGSNGTCTLCAAAMMLRRAAMMNGDGNWKTITEAAVKPTAWAPGLKWDFTYKGMRVKRYDTLPGNSNNASTLINVLKNHQEGIVLYDRALPHAVLLTDYTNGEFYCCDPEKGYKTKLSATRINLNRCKEYWCVTSSVNWLETEKPSTPTEKPPTPVYTGTVTTIPDGVYTIRCAANTAFVIDLQGGSTKDGAQIQLYRYYKPTDNQKFRFTKNSDGTYKIANVKTGKVVDVANAALLNHTNVQQWTDNNTAAQRWYVEKNSDGTYSIRSKCNNLYLDIWGGEIKNESKITTYVGNYSAAQRFLLWPVDVENQVEGDVLSVSGINASYTQTGSAITPIPTVQRVVYQKEAMRVPQSGTASADYIWQDACWITKGKTYTVDVGSLQRLSGNNTQATMALYDFGVSKFLHEKRFDISANKQTYTFTAPADGMLLFYAGVTGACKGCAVQWNNVTVREKLVANTDYVCSYANNINPGTATLTVTLKGSFKKSKSASFKITEAPKPTPTPTPTPKPAPSPAPTPDVGDTQEAGQMMYRLYNPNSGEHFYTASTAERDNVIEAGWNDEGVGWTAPGSGIQVYRLYNPYAGEHHYTTSEEERDVLVSVGWIWEEGGWFSNPDGGMPLYRAYNPNAYSNNHHYTSDWGEFQTLLSVGWLDEGVGWYGVG